MSPQGARPTGIDREFLRELAREHAALSSVRSPREGYEATACKLGSSLALGAAAWIAVGAPGAPRVSAFVNNQIAPHANAAGVAVWAALALYVVGELEWARPARWALRSPMRLVGRLWWALTLLTGVAALGATSLLVGAVVLRLVGLTHP